MGKPAKKHVAADDESRVCLVCNIEKRLNTEFYFHSTSEYYLNLCKDCYNRRRRLQWRGLPIPKEYDVLKYKPKTKRVIENKPWRKTSRANRKRLQYKATDKRRDFISDLTVEFVEKSLLSPCYYCGFQSCGLDRIDNNRGHIMKNCVPCCFECNIARGSNFTHEEMIEIGKVIKIIKEKREKNGVKSLVYYENYNN